MNPFRSLVYCSVVTLIIFAVPVAAQNYTTDARIVAMGGAGGHGNDALRLAGDARSYRAIGLPIGLFQVLRNTDVFNPDNRDEFDPLRAITLLSNPLHYTFGLDEDSPGDLLVRDIVRGRLSRDLNTYRGFEPRPAYDAAGLLSPTFGYTARLKGEKDGPFQGIYVGAGPYLSLSTFNRFDQRLADILSANSATYVPNTSFSIFNTTEGQGAAAFTVGYRARLAIPRGSVGASKRDGIYVAANYNYLRGFRRDAAATQVRFDTDALGLLTLNPQSTPVAIDHTWSTKGNGYAIDIGTVAVIDHWELNFAANGLANRIDWDDNQVERLALTNLLQGMSFARVRVPAVTSSVRVKLPVQYAAGGGYHTERWAAVSEVAHGLQHWEFRGGGEYRLRIVEFRGGTQYKNKDWQPTGGAGLNITPRIGIDAAVFGTSTNIERKRKAALALSLRIETTR